MDGCNVDKNLHKSMALVGRFKHWHLVARGSQQLSEAFGYIPLIEALGNDKRGTELARA